ncbi:hypothetical protein LBBP_02538 [Leptospira borgpetersenii serovar Ballum]|uniref:Uncharacterized protein n=1 Tax=Leptospira borgpetersenii serovar Ballum TaxID=280505 RepID=A0A0S2ISX4_LEPBO|nr:hypothetical protein LBBP_02538 [Leptospira borgpetersenii serovar Ballum]
MNHRFQPPNSHVFKIRFSVGKNSDLESVRIFFYFSRKTAARFRIGFDLCFGPWNS